MRFLLRWLFPRRFDVGLLGMLFVALVIAPLLILPTAPARAATLTVTSGADDGAGSLRAAIAAAVAGDTIEFSVATVTLTSAELLIDKSLIIDGGASGVTITRSGALGTPQFRIFKLVGAENEVTLEGLTISNGYPQEPSVDENGEPSLIVGNGGAVFIEGVSLTVRNSTFSANQATNGGGIYNDGGTLSVSDSTFNDHTFPTNGGAIYNDGGTLSVERSRFIDNNANFGGGAIYNNAGSATLLESTFSANTSNNRGGGIYNVNGTLTVLSSTLNANRVSSAESSSIGGGGLYSEGGVLTVTNSTLSGNEVENTSILEGGNGDGGAIFNTGSTLSLINSTLSNNSATHSGGGIYTFNDTSGSLTLANTIVASNTGELGNDVYNSGLLTAIGKNIVQQAVVGRGVLVGSTNIRNVDPKLGPLADNGGPTLTHLPSIAEASPAIDAGVDDVALAPDGTPLSTDQRGEVRNSGERVDIGAVEVEVIDTPITFVSYGVSLTSSQVNRGSVGAETQVKGTVTRSGTTTVPGSVRVTLGGTAVQVTDYSFAFDSASGVSFANGTLSFAAGVSEAIFTLTVRGSAPGVGPKTVIITLADPTPSSNAVLNPSSATLTINSDSNPGLPDNNVTYGVTLQPGDVTEPRSGQASPEVTVTVTRTRINATSSVEVNLSGTATRGEDYSFAFDAANSSGASFAGNTLSFAANATTARFTLRVLPDSEIDPDETVIIRLANGTPAGNITLNPIRAILTIRDAGVDVVYGVTLQPGEVTEPTSEQTSPVVAVTVTRTAINMTSSVEVNLSGTATRGADYRFDFDASNSPGASFAGNTLSFAANVTTASFTLRVLPDSEVEPTETVIVELANGTPAGSVTFNPLRATLSIREVAAANDGLMIYLPLVLR